MAGRTFQDASGTEWEVFEVRRSVDAPRGVTVGNEKGWLAFVSRNAKRRLAHYPEAWELASVADLELMCASARASQPARFPTRRGQVPSNAGPAPSVGRLPTALDDGVAEDPANPVRVAVRGFAREARASKMPAVAALVRLKALLHERFGGADSDATAMRDARDIRQVRRWFVEAFYFESTDQSR